MCTLSAYRELPLVRTGLVAIVDGVTVAGCCECKHNYEKKTVFFLPPTHYCDARIDGAAKHKIIFDPLNIPADCPFIPPQPEVTK